MQSPASSPRHTNGSNGHSTSTISEQDLLRRTSRVLRQLYLREQRWIETRTPSQLSDLTQQGQLPLNEQLHYGEIAFVLLRLKPCAIIDFATEDKQLLNDYVQRVIQPTVGELNALGLLAKKMTKGQQQQQQRRAESNSAWYPREFRLACARIEGQLASPEVPSWTGAYALYDEMWDESRDWARANLLDVKKGRISEDELARGLDYPGSIPKTNEDMQLIVPVSYLGRIKSESGEWLSDRWECLTSFIVLQHELPQMALHRIRYEAIRMFDIEMQVAMDTSLIEEFPIHSEN